MNQSSKGIQQSHNTRQNIKCYKADYQESCGWIPGLGEKNRQVFITKLPFDPNLKGQAGFDRWRLGKGREF